MLVPGTLAGTVFMVRGEYLITWLYEVLTQGLRNHIDCIGRVRAIN